MFFSVYSSEMYFKLLFSMLFLLPCPLWYRGSWWQSSPLPLFSNLCVYPTLDKSFRDSTCMFSKISDAHAGVCQDEPAVGRLTRKRMEKRHTER